MNPNVRTRSQLTYEYDLIQSMCILILSDSPKAPDAMTMMNEMNFIFLCAIKCFSSATKLIKSAKSLKKCNALYIRIP